MVEYQNFVGIDIGKFNFVVAIHGQGITKEYENTTDDITKFLDEYKDILSNSLIVMEPTGGYELELLYTLCDRNYAVHRSDTSKVKKFIESYGNGAKTDELDAKALAHYGQERYKTLALFLPQSKQALELFRLSRRKNDLKKILVAEKNRLQAPSSKAIHNSCKNMIRVIDKQISMITEQIQETIDSDPILKEKQKVLKTIPGIGDAVSSELLILLPELGNQMTRRTIASLAGLAPRANDSGKFKGYRRTGHGRSGVKPYLFLAAMAARNSKSHLKEFYERLIAKGKKKMVALTALMRKIIVIANAKLKALVSKGEPRTIMASI